MKTATERLVTICQLFLQPLKAPGKLYFLCTGMKALDDGSTNASRQAAELILR